jgi:hypothetical protein
VDDILPQEPKNITAAATEFLAPEALEESKSERASIAASEDESFISVADEESIVGDPPQATDEQASSLSPADKAPSGADWVFEEPVTPREASAVSKDRPFPPPEQPPPNIPTDTGTRQSETPSSSVVPTAEIQSGRERPRQEATEPTASGLSSPPSGDKPSSKDKKKETPAPKRRIGWFKRIKMAGEIIGKHKFPIPSTC